jgi:hypothetical protein
MLRLAREMQAVKSTALTRLMSDRNESPSL